MSKTALVLQGGAVRGNFTAGVLDVFLQNNIKFDCVVGVSAGALCGCNFCSKQVGRSERINTIYCDDKRFMSIRNLFLHFDMFNFKWLFGKCARITLPFDFDTFNRNPTRLVVVASSVSTGRPAYFEKGKTIDIYKAAAASASIPLLSRIKRIEHQKFLDGGVTDPIPFEYALKEGYDRIVVVTTQDRAYRKTKSIAKIQKILLKMCYFMYKDYLKRVLNYNAFYNEQVTKLYQYEKEGKLFLIAPDKPITLSRSEKDASKRQAVYYQGYNQAKEMLEAVKEYIK